MTLTSPKANLPNLRRLFIEARSDHEEREVSRKTVGFWRPWEWARIHVHVLTRQFYNAVLFMGSVAVFSLIAQRMNAPR
jgi:hypothetical protein